MNNQRLPLVSLMGDLYAHLLHRLILVAYLLLNEDSRGELARGYDDESYLLLTQL